MERYIFDTHYGKCTLTDTQTGIIVEWQSGKFNETNAARLEPLSTLHTETDAGRLAERLAHIMREMADYARANYAELL